MAPVTRGGAAAPVDSKSAHEKGVRPPGKDAWRTTGPRDTKALVAPENCAGGKGSAVGAICARFVALAGAVFLLDVVWRLAVAAEPFDFPHKADGTAVTLQSIVTAAWPGFFYVQQADRAAGIRILWPDLLKPGDDVGVEGTLGRDGPERAIAATSVRVIGRDAGLPEPLAFGTGNLGGESLANSPGVPGAWGLYNIGLRVCVPGAVSRSAEGGALLRTHLVELRVEPGALAWPGDGTIVVVTGISSLAQTEAGAQPLIRATDVKVMADWLPATIMFVGDSLTEGLFASTEAKAFVSRTMDKLQAAYPQRSFQKQVLFGTDGSPMRTIARTIRSYNGPWPDVVVIQDAATQSNPMTGGATNGLAIITTDASGKVIGARPDPATPGSGYQWKYPGEGSALGNLVTFRQGENTSAGGLATISSAGVPVSYAVQTGGSMYDSGQPVQVLTDDWLALAESAIDDILMRWGTPQNRPLVVFAGLWQQPKAEFELDGVTMNWNEHWARFLGGPKYAGKVFHVPEFGSASYEYWALGWYYRATCDGGNTWVFKYTVPFDPAGKGLYLRDGKWASLITGWDGQRTVTTQEPRGKPRTDPELWVNLIQASPWYTSYGDGYHPTDAGHEALGQGVYDAIQRGIAARNAE